MSSKSVLLAAGIAAAAGFSLTATAFAHGAGGGWSSHPHGRNQGHHMGGMTGHGMWSHGQMRGPGGMGQGNMGQGNIGMRQGHNQPGWGMGPGNMAPGNMGGGMIGGGMMGGGMMGGGMMGGGMMGGGMMHPLRQDLSVEDVEHMMGHRVAWQNNANIKVGKVAEKDDDTISVEIVTQDGSLVQKLDVDRHTGRMQPSQ